MLLFLSSGHAQRALFEPPKDRQLLIIGQDLGSIGGFPAPHNDGYSDHIKIKPGGITTYLSLPALRGMTSSVNLFAGDLHAQAIVDNPFYKDSVLAIGLHFVDQEKKIAAGEQDDRIKVLAEWVKSVRRPVFLRIGYEFDGSWNHYEPEAYKKSFQRIVKIFRELKVTNCAMVWQSCTSPANGNKKKNILDWYPGDEFVDWMGYSWFLTSKEQVDLTDKLLALARERGKPVMVCEAAPQGYDLARLTKRSIYKGKDPRDKTAEQIWNEWYKPWFAYLDKNKDVVRVVAYINANWDAQWFWGWPYISGYWGDSRVEANDEIRKKWLEAISAEKWLKASPALFQELQPAFGKVPAP